MKLTKMTLTLLFALSASSTYALNLECKFKATQVPGVDSIHMDDNYLTINNRIEMTLDKSKVNCAHFGKKTRYDGSANGFQVVLKNCTSDAAMEGHLIDVKKEVAAEVVCDHI